MATKTAIIKATVLGDADNFKQSMKESANAAEGAERDINESFDKFGEGAGSAEQKFIGFKDSITGTQDVISGLKSGNVLVLAQGAADLAGAGEALWASFGKAAVSIGKKVAATVTDTAATIGNTAATVANRVATFAAEAATKAWAAAQWLLNAALSANPIVLIVIGIAALVAAFILAWQHSETFRNIVTGAFNVVWGVIQGVWGWIKENFPKLLGWIVTPFQTGLSVIQGVWNWINDNWHLLLAILTGPIGLAVLAITTHWDTIKNGIKGVYDSVEEKFNWIVDVIRGVPGRIWAVATGMFDGVGQAFQDVINWVIGEWNRLRKQLLSSPLKGAVGGAAKGGFNPIGIAAGVLGFADGGLVKGGQGGVLGMVGEKAHDELIIPLDRFNKNGLGNTIVLNLNVPATANPVDTGREVRRVLNRYERTLATR